MGICPGLTFFRRTFATRRLGGRSLAMLLPCMLTVKVELPNERQELLVVVVRRQESLEFPNLHNAKRREGQSGENRARRCGRLIVIDQVCASKE